MTEIQSKLFELKQLIKKCGAAAVAFSGGVDSSFLSKIVFDELNSNSLAITISGNMMPESELAASKKIAESIGIKHIIINAEGIDEKVRPNPIDRCYHCKKIEFGIIKAKAAEFGINYVFDGSNADDENDYRPGLKAIEELSVVSPLRLCALSKLEIRILSKELKLETYDKPSYACLASRIPFGDEITKEKLNTVESAEEFLKAKGLRQFRVRHHGNICRIEISPDERYKFFDCQIIDEVSKYMKTLGFIYVCMELEGYKTGSLNPKTEIEL